MQCSVGIKTEFKKINTLCYACLASDRILEPLGAFTGVYRNICNSWDSGTYLDVLVCWECKSLLKRVKQFTEKADQSQNILYSYIPGADEKPPKCLSKLSTSKTLTFDSLQPIETEPETVDNVQPPEIKEEIEDIPDNTSDVIKDFEYELLDEVKEENLSNTLLNELKSIKKEKKHRSKHFTIIPLPDVKEMVKQVKINPSEIDYWRDKERSSTYFQSLPSRCELCIMQIPKNHTIQRHMSHFHGKNKKKNRYPCNICERVLSTKFKLGRHVAAHSIILECTACGYQCCGKQHMRCHIGKHKRTVQCAYCSTRYENVREFYNHYREVHCKFICDYCNKKCVTKRVIEKHIMRHHTEMQCKICDKTFASYTNLLNHNQLKHESNPTEASFCVACNIQFENVAIFKRHLYTSVAHAKERAQTTSVKRKFVCPKCPNAYASKYSMVNHYSMVHSDQKNARYYCADCDKFFLNRTRLRDHQKYSHEGLVPRKDKLCSFCGRGFSTNRILTNHIRTHTGERPFSCTLCDAKFTQKVALQSHIRYIHLKASRKGGF